MNDRNISVTSVTAVGLWIAGGSLVIVGAFFSLWFTGVGLYLAGIGGVLSIRRMFCQQEARERNAFEIGVGVGRDRLHSL